MGTHPIFESDFDCLTDMHRSLPRGAIQQVKPHVKGINFPSRATWTPSIPKTGPQIPAHIVALSTLKFLKRAPPGPPSYLAPSELFHISILRSKSISTRPIHSASNCPRPTLGRFH